MAAESGKAYKELLQGTIFIKYGKYGNPKSRHVYLFDNGKRLCWKDPGAQKHKSSIVVKDIR